MESLPITTIDSSNIGSTIDQLSGGGWRIWTFEGMGIYSPLPLAARATRQGRTSSAAIMDSAKGKDTLGT